MKKLIFLFFITCSLTSVAQKDSLQLGDRYAEDQLYVMVSYNQLFNQPAMVKGSRFSYGLSTGFMKDLILNKQGSISMALGVGYNFDLLNHGLTISEENNDITFQADNSGATNKLLLHNLEFPFELRWRGSDAQTYKFWRVYMGVKASYNLSNNFKFTNETNSFSYSNVSNYNTWQYGLTLSVGYDVFTAHVYYGLNPILKDTSLGTADISSKIMRIGLIFYLL
jgi:hypothetical protein|tara:strand:+ start:64 stop:735 length:672 start_codon:yes stop_codon:yes gene_type:complete